MNHSETGKSQRFLAGIRLLLFNGSIVTEYVPSHKKGPDGNPGACTLRGFSLLKRMKTVVLCFTQSLKSPSFATIYCAVAGIARAYIF